MAKRNRTHITDETSGKPVDLAPKHLTKHAFAKRLYKLMVSKGWNQSELARRAGLPRDSVSTYVRAKVLPTPQSVQGLAAALGVEPHELMPNHVESAIEDDMPSLEMRVSVNAPGKAWLRVNRLVSLSTAAKVIGLIDAAEESEGEK